MQLNADYKLDLCTLFGRYNHRRVVGVYLMAGAGLNYGFNNKEAASIAANSPSYMEMEIGEDSVILTLEDVVGSVTYGLNDKSIVDKTFTKGLDDFNVAFDCEVRSDAKHSFVHVSILVLVLIHNDYRTKVW